MVIPGCVDSDEILEKTHPLLLSQACQAQLGMTKRVRDGSITLDDYDAQSLEVVRQVGTGLFMIRTDHIWYTTMMFATLFWKILSSTLTTNLVLTARLEIQTNRMFPIVSRMRWLMFAVVRFRGVCFSLTR